MRTENILDKIALTGAPRKYVQVTANHDYMGRRIYEWAATIWKTNVFYSKEQVREYFRSRFGPRVDIDWRD